MNPIHPDDPFPPGQNPARQPPRKRKGNVIPLRKPVPETAETILAELEQKGKAQDAYILDQLQRLNRELAARREVDIRGLVMTARSLRGPDLADLIEVASRLAVRRTLR